VRAKVKLRRFCVCFVAVEE